VTDGEDARAGLVRLLGEQVAGLGLGELQIKGCALAGREPTADEWVRMVGAGRPQVPVCAGTRR